MIRFRAIFSRVIKELIRDKRTLALMLLAPMLILTLMKVVFDTNDEVNLQLGVTADVPSAVVKNLPKEVHSRTFSTDDPEKMIQEHHLDAFLSFNNHTLLVTYENVDPAKTAQLKGLIQNSLTIDHLQTLTKEVQIFAKETDQNVKLPDYTLKAAYVYGHADSTFFDKILPILIGFFVFFFVFLVSGIALLKERTSGTLERVLATPVKRSEIVLGYLAGYGLFAIIQTLLIVFFALYILQFTIAGNLLWVVLTNILIALVALAMGIFVSTFANSEFQMMQFIPIVVIPQVFFSGLIPLDSMAGWVHQLSYIFPLSYGGQALSDVMIKGADFSTIAPNLGVLLLFLVGFTCLNIIGLKRYRKV